MASADGDAVFEVDERPTTPGGPPKTATSRWRAFTSMALQRGLGRLSDGEFDQGNAEGATVEAAPGTAPAPALAPESAPTPTPTLNPWKHGPRGTVRIVARDRGPTGTVLIPRRTAPRARAAVKAPPRSRSRWWAAAIFAVVAGAQVVLLAGKGPATQVEPAAVAPQSPTIPSPVATEIAEPPPAPEPTFEETDPPVVVAGPATTAAAHAKPPTRARARKGVHAASNVL